MKAFPETAIGNEGMDLRDYFAAKAMQAWINEIGRPNWEATIAKYAYQQADAMMKAREN
jgi:hypothetical protein